MNDHAKGRNETVFIKNQKNENVACLEVVIVKERYFLTQAKINYNTPISQNNSLMGLVLKWAEQNKMQIKTNDIMVV